MSLVRLPCLVTRRPHFSVDIKLYLGLIELYLGLIELYLGLIELYLGLIELFLGLIELPNTFEQFWTLRGDVILTLLTALVKCSKPSSV